MVNWIFKISSQDIYSDEPGLKYVYDNTHSVRVRAGDSYVYLDKRSGSYAFTGYGMVKTVRSRKARAKERRNALVKRVYTAGLADFVHYPRPVDLRPRSRQGRANRDWLGISDVNKLGWSSSIARLGPLMYESIIELVYRQGNIVVDSPNHFDHEVPDSWSRVKSRHTLEKFKRAVLSRQNHTCAICGTKIKELLDVAHISPYASDKKNRANPANGIGLCVFCHRAFDRRILSIRNDGTITVRGDSNDDPIARAHFRNLSRSTRGELISGVDKTLLGERSGPLVDQKGTD